ncbi:DUF3331 domain-containing protein [Burkholderia diffusa]|uniref:DUF3331 domain-containing protein n=1 Tax=Burkholderia diffusa TaxID=488732 RepID=UPI002AB08603|nr:DUF3331 domain-containing protein [Burkholderia diffusa]
MWVRCVSLGRWQVSRCAPRARQMLKGDLSEDTIVVRALLNVLDPSAERLDTCAKQPFVKLTQCHVSVCKRVTRRPANIDVVSRISSSAISVSWSDACLGRYTEQIWSRGIANVAGVCALTGRHINCGDQVFRPRACEGHVSLNRDLMILAGTAGQCLDSAMAGT